MANLKAAKAILKQIPRVAESVIEGETDYHWFRNSLYPSVQLVARSARSAQDKRLASEAMFMLGDLFDLCFDAPRAAARCYRRSIRLGPRSGRAWRELGTMLHRVGKYHGAKRKWERAKAIQTVASDLLYIERDISQNVTPLYVRGEPCHEASEALARFQPKQALSRLRGLGSIQARRCRIRIYEAMNDYKGALRGWTAIARASGVVELDLADFYFLSEEVWNSLTFWQAILDIDGRFGDGMYPKDDSFPKSKRVPKNLDLYSAQMRRERQRRWHLSAVLHIARIRRDAKTVRRLVGKFPSWQTAKDVLKRLQESA